MNFVNVLSKRGNKFRNTKLLFSTSSAAKAKHSCKVLVVGGGTGGCATAAKLSKILKKHELIILEPNNYHFYQPLFTLIGGGISSLSDARKEMKDVLPENATWIQDSAAEYEPKFNLVSTTKGDVIEYEHMLVATGLQTNYNDIPGLIEALNIPDGKVCSNYSHHYVNRTFRALQNFDHGNVIFTFPNTPVKCPGAPQKICYIAEHYLRKSGKRANAKVIYNTSLPVLFGVQRYADALWKVCQKRDIEVNLRTNLIEINAEKNEAVFQNLDKPNMKIPIKFSFLHVTPPMGAPDSLRQCKELVTETGFLDVDKSTLQSNKFSNIFGIGDCTSSPNSKTAAAAASQCLVVFENLKAEMNGAPLPSAYDGYASCPLVTGYDTCILAEFDYNLKPLETFPFDQDKELYSMYVLKKSLMPPLYWGLMMNGYWNGPKTMRNLLHLKLF